MSAPSLQHRLVDPDHPWLGLESFTEATQRYFFGRDAEISEIYVRAKENPLTILYGQSGLGKSSLLGAGLIPKLKLENLRPVLMRLRFEKTDAPLLDQVKAAIAGIFPRAEAVSIIDPDAPEAQPLWETFHYLPLLPADLASSPPVLIFDQFEELFTLGQRPERQEEVTALIEELADVIENRPPAELKESFKRDRRLVRDFDLSPTPLRIVITLREDYLSHLESWKRTLPSLMRNRMALRLLSGPQALDAVFRPGQIEGRHLVDEDTAARIVRFVANRSPDVPLTEIGAVPPLLSLVCDELNTLRIEQRQDRITTERISAERLRSSSGSTGEDDLEVRSRAILERFYQRCFNGFPRGVRHLVEEKMVTIAGNRCPVSLDDAHDALAKCRVKDPAETLTALVNRRLISAEVRGRVKWYEITHDVLVPIVREFRDKRLARQRLRRLLLASAGLLALLGVFGGITAWALSQKGEALAAAKKLAEANREKLQTLKEASMADYAVAVQRIEQDGKWHEGVAHLARALKWDAGNVLAATRLYSTICFYADEKQTCPWQTLPHADSVFGAQFSPKSSRIVTARSGNKAHIWDTVAGKTVGQPMIHQGLVTACEFSPNGALVVTASADKTARVWNANTGNPIGKEMRHHSDVVSAHFSPDGTRIVTASRDTTAKLWDPTTGEAIGDAMPHSSIVNSAQFSPDSSRIVTVSADNTARIWDVTTGKQIGAPLDHKSSVKSGQFAPDSARIVTVCADGTVQIWDGLTGNRCGRPLLQDQEVNSAQFSPDGCFVVTASNDKTACLWNADTGKAVGKPMHHDEPVTSAQFSPDGRRVLTSSGSRSFQQKGASPGRTQIAQIWDVVTGQPLGEALRHDGYIRSAQFSADGAFVVTASDDHTARVWNAASGKSVSEPLRHAGQVKSAQFSPSGVNILTVGGDFSVRVWDASTGLSIGAPMSHAAPVTSAQFSPNGELVVTACKDKAARLWDAKTGKIVGVEMLHHDRVNCVQFSPDGSLIVTASGDVAGGGGEARVWATGTQKAVGVPFHHAKAVNCVVFNSDGKRIVTASGEFFNSTGEARIWDAMTGHPIGSALMHAGQVISAQFSCRGNLIVTASDDKTARVWDAASGMAIGKGPLHDSGVRSAQFSFDGTRVVTASSDGSAQVWDVASDRAIGEALRHDDWVNTAQFSPDAKLVITSSNDHTARVWISATGKSIGELLRNEEAVNTAQFSPDGSKIVTANSDATARLWLVPKLAEPPAQVPEWFLARAYAVAGLEFDTDGAWRILSAEARRAALLAPVSGNDAWCQLARWLATPASERTLTPDSQFTNRQIAERERDSGTTSGLESALRYDPTVPLGHILLAGALLRDDAGKKVAERDPKAAQRAAFLRTFGLKLLPEDSGLWARAAASLFEQRDYTLALGAAEKALSLDAKNVPSLCTRAHCLIALGDAVNALAALRTAQEIAVTAGGKPEATLRASLAAALWLNHEPDQALDTFARLIETDPVWAKPGEILRQGLPESETEALEAVRAETLMRHPKLAPKVRE